MKYYTLLIIMFLQLVFLPSQAVLEDEKSLIAMLQNTIKTLPNRLKEDFDMIGLAEKYCNLLAHKELTLNNNDRSKLCKALHAINYRITLTHNISLLPEPIQKHISNFIYYYTLEKKVTRDKCIAENNVIDPVIKEAQKKILYLSYCILASYNNVLSSIKIPRTFISKVFDDKGDLNPLEGNFIAMVCHNTNGIFYSQPKYSSEMQTYWEEYNCDSLTYDNIQAISAYSNNKSYTKGSYSLIFCPKESPNITYKIIKPDHEITNKGDSAQDKSLVYEVTYKFNEHTYQGDPGLLSSNTAVVEDELKLLKNYA